MSSPSAASVGVAVELRPVQRVLPLVVAGCDERVEKVASGSEGGG